VPGRRYPGRMMPVNLAAHGGQPLHRDVGRTQACPSLALSHISAINYDVSAVGGCKSGPWSAGGFIKADLLTGAGPA